MGPIGPGDWVECLRTWPSLDGSSEGFRVGGLYCVEAVYDSDEYCDHCRTCCDALSFSNIAPDQGWISCAFRPIYRPREDLIQQLLQPVSETVRDVVSAD